MNNTSDAVWQRAKCEAKAALIETAKKGAMIFYSFLIQKIEAIAFEAYDPNLDRLLGEISTEEDQNGRGMLSVVVVHKSDNRPGDGFFRLAKNLGKNVSDREAFWVCEFKKVCDYWSKNPES